MIDMKQLGGSLAAAVNEAFEKRFAPELAELRRRLDNLPAPEPGKPGDRGDKGDAGEPGKDGERGEKGEQGEKGDAGEAGIAGPEGQKGERGPAGDRGEKGQEGRDGRDGKDGRDGEDGKDALEIDVLPMIEEGKQYRRGTFATHRGGTWHARKNAVGFDDAWHCIMDGIADAEEVTDGRVTTKTVTRSSGVVTKTVTKSAAMIYRGLFVRGSAFEVGDTVTWGGHLWHCEQDTAEPPSEQSKAWRLAVKRGADGKAAK